MRHKGFPICPYYDIRAYVRNVVAAEWRGREDPLQHVGALQRGFHAGYLHPRHPEDEAGGSRDYWERDRPGDVSKLSGAGGSFHLPQKLHRAFAPR